MHVAILGNGVTGVSAAVRLRARRPDWRITLISGESTYHWSRPALMYVFMGHMRYADTKPFEDAFWREQRLDLVRGWVTGLDLANRRLALDDGRTLAWDRLLLATGSRPNRFGWPGQDLAGVQGLYGLPDLALLHENVRHARHAVIVGGGLIGIELAEMLHGAGIGVTLLVRERSYWGSVLPAGESDMVNREIRAHGLDLRLGAELAAIEDDGRGRVAGITTRAGERIACQIVGLTAGVSPNLDLVRGSEVATARGILVDARLRTRVPGVFAAGDCAEIEGLGPGGRPLLQQVWYTGKMQGEVAGDNLAALDEPPRDYDPGVWFNSAKFLDLEYQTYGRVNLQVPGEQSLYWEAPGGREAVRLVHVDGALIGVNVMGTRWRHEVCERWVREARPVAHVLDHLDDAHFDAEFARRHARDIRAAFLQEVA